MIEPNEIDDLLNDYMEFCGNHGYGDHELTKNQAVTIMQFVWWRDKAMLVENLAYISQSGESYAPAFKRFLADMIDGKLKKPNGSHGDPNRDFRIIIEMMKCLRQGHKFSGESNIENTIYEYGVRDFVIEKFGVSETHVKNLMNRYINDQLKNVGGDKELIKKHFPELAYHKLLR